MSTVSSLGFTGVWSRWDSEALSAVVLLRFGGGGAEPSAGRFLHDRCRVPGRLSGPRRFGTRSYSQGLDLRLQLLHTGLVESHRILRARLLRRPKVVSICGERGLMKHH